MLLVPWQSGAASGGPPGKSSGLTECLLRYPMSGLLLFGLTHRIMVFQLTNPFATLSTYSSLAWKMMGRIHKKCEVFHLRNILLVTSLQPTACGEILHFIYHCGVISPAAWAWHIICQRAAIIWPQPNLSTVCWDTLYFLSFFGNNSWLSTCCCGRSHNWKPLLPSE